MVIFLSYIIPHMHGILFLRCHARLKSRLRAAVMWQMHVINKPSFVLCSFQIILPAVAVMAGALDFTVCYDLTKVYISTLRIVWTRRCCIYHGSKMGMTPQRLLCTLKGSGSVSLRSTRSCAVLCVNPRVFCYVSIIHNICITCY